MENTAAIMSPGSDSREGAPSAESASFQRYFTVSGQDPFQTVDWQALDCTISNEHGRIVFEQKAVEAPVTWSQMATNVAASKYFRGALGTPQREHSIRQLISRVVDTITTWAEQQAYFNDKEELQAFHDELIYIVLHQYAAFNSPVWFNVGIVEKPQCSACFILSVDDSIESLLELQATEAKLFKYGSGAGTNLSSIRSTRELLSGGGIPSGPISFMKGFDAWASIIKSGGKTRRAAKMQILEATHPDIREFVVAKLEEEKKAWALIEQGYSADFFKPGSAYDCVNFQNANLSVRVNDEFMQAVENDETYWTKKVADGEPCEKQKARDIFRLIAEATHACGDPGLQFDTEINAWHTCPSAGRIRASNPCSEYMHLDNSACNLASINLLKFIKPGGDFEVQAFCHTVKTLTTAQDILIDNSSYPTKKIERCARDYRQLGLGFANLGATLMTMALPYDSDEGRNFAAGVTALLTGQAYKTSAHLAKRLGHFAGYSRDKKAMLRVVNQHREALKKINSPNSTLELCAAAEQAWNEALHCGKKSGFRNSQTTVLAPTGTISFLMDCATTGIEPDIALVKHKKLIGGGYLKLVNTSVSAALAKLSYSPEERVLILRYIDDNGTIEGAPALKPEHLPVFDCAFKPANGERFIQYQGHLKMMAAVQPFISGAISKTVNLPSSVSVEEIQEIYLEAWKQKLKAVALYRDGSKRAQPLGVSNKEKEALNHPLPLRRKLPDERQSITHKFSIATYEGYITVGLFSDGSPGELFLIMSKEGSTLSGLLDAFATSISLALQYGVPLAALVRKFSYMRFEPSGFTHNTDIPLAHSIIDYVFRWLGKKFLTSTQLEAIGLKPENKTIQNGTVAAKSDNQSNGELTPTFENSLDAPPCTQCGSSLMVRQAGCYVCLNCGAQGGCG